MTASWRNSLTKARPVLQRLAYSALPPVLLAVTLVLSEYQKNLTEVYPGTLVIPLIEAIGIGLIPYLIFRKIWTDRLAITIASFLAVPLFYDYDPRIGEFGPILKALSPVSNDTVINLLCIALLLAACGLVGWGASRLVARTAMNRETVARALILAATVSFLVGAATDGIELAGVLPQMQPLNAPKLNNPAKTASAKPDIYYIVLEDYAGKDTLQSVYDFDNSPFLSYLTGQGFTVPDAMYSNYPYTSDSIPSTLEMNYLVDSAARFKNSPQSEFPMRSIFDNPPVVSALKQQGYQYLNVGSWWEATRNVPAANVNYADPFKLHLGGYSHTMSEFDMALLGKSVFGHLLRPGISIGKYRAAYLSVDDPAQIVSYQLDTLKKLASSPDQGGRFIFGHIILPHPPFIFNANGSTPVYDSGANNLGTTAERKYANQLSYINSQTKALIDHIKQSSKTPPVIILQSDEGPHPSELGQSDEESVNFDLLSLAPAKLKQKYDILAAYDLPGATPEETAQINSPVNAFRVVLNHYLGYSLPMLPDCSFATKPGKLLDFIDITARLRGSADPACADIHK